MFICFIQQNKNDKAEIISIIISENISRMDSYHSKHIELAFQTKKVNTMHQRLPLK